MNERILLLVDDEAHMLTALERLLRPDGYRILKAGNGEDALGLLKDHDVGVIMSDHRMPGISGAELLQLVKAHYPHTIRILHSGYADLQSVSDAINQGAIYRYLTKPCDGNLLRANIQDAFSQYELQKQNERLTRELKDVNNELIIKNQALDAALVKANNATRIKSQFLANMSHEIRTPMNGVLGMVELLLGTDLSAQQLGYVEAVRCSGKLLLAIINDILDLSRLEANKRKMENIEFNLRDIVEDVSESLAVLAHKKSLELGCFIDDSTPAALCGDTSRLRQILTNLISNAIKFTTSGEVWTSVSILKDMQNSVFLKFEVRDTGIGIESGVREKIFEAFSQADGSTNRVYGGTGLGLAICKQLVESMDGEIGIDSKPGDGSIFWFVLQLDKAGHTCAPESQTGLCRKRILVVDQNETARNVIQKYLAAWGVEVECAADEGQALRLMEEAVQQERPYQLCLMDYYITGHDDEGLMCNIKHNNDLSSLQMVLMTPLGLRNNNQIPSESGFSGKLTKPVRYLQLYQCLTRILNDNKVYPEAVEVSNKKHCTPSLENNNALARSKVSVKGKRILVAEDNQISQEVIKGMLENMGFEIDVVNNGAEAVKVQMQHHYDLIFMDCQMPGMDGFEATGIIRRDENKHIARHAGASEILMADSRVPIIALTANVLPDDREKCLAAQMDDFIAKPIDMHSLCAVLDRWLTGSVAVNGNRIQDVVHGTFSDTEREYSEPASLPEDPVSVLDLHRLAEHKKIMKGKFPVLIEMFLQDIPLNLAALLEAAEKMDSDLISRIAHKLVGSGSNIGARILVDLCRELELQARNGTLCDALEQVRSIEKVYVQTKDALEAILLETESVPEISTRVTH